jgi:hypothetical protein
MINEYEVASLIGGELFQDNYGDEVTEKLELVLSRLLKLYQDGRLKTLWFNITLTKPLNELTSRWLDIFNNTDIDISDPRHGVFVCTSWDYVGRFHTDAQFATWTSNMNTIATRWPRIKKSIAIILTGDFMKMYASTGFSIADFVNKHDASVFLKQPFIIYKDGYTVKPAAEPNFINKSEFNSEIGYSFYPTRDVTLQFMYALAQREPSLLAALFTIGKRSNELVKCWGDDIYIENRFTTGKIEISGGITVNDNCGHTYSYQSYADSDACIRCDRDIIYESVFGEKFID